jgi:predicted transposase/invertase (TIGR01784 family)
MSSLDKNHEQANPPRLYFKLKNDLVFKRFFTQNTEHLKHLLESTVFIDEHIADLVIENTKEPDVRDKNIDFDIKLTALMAGKRKINLEIQNKRQIAWKERCLYYISRLVCQNNLTQGDDYSGLIPCYGVWFMGENILKSPSCHSIYKLMEENTGDFFPQLFIHIFELKKVFRDAYYQQRYERGALWLRLLNADKEEEMEDIAQKSEYMNRVVNDFNELGQDPELLELAQRRQECAYFNARDRQLERQEGRQEGILEIARSMKEEGLKIQTIAKCTGLTEDEIRAL